MSELMCRGYRVEPEAGVVYGKLGSPIRKRDCAGYIVVNTNGKHIAPAHRLIWEAVNGPIPDGLEINHINGIKADNRISNLELVTRSENLLHAHRIGLCKSSKKGEANNYSKLTEEMVREIRADTKTKGVDLARRYGVSPKAISHVRVGRNWSHI